MNADGTNLTQLTNNTSRDIPPSWSPDGKRVAFVSDRDGNDEIYVMNADGTNVTRLTNNDAYDSQPHLVAGRQSHSLHIRPRRVR